MNNYLTVYDTCENSIEIKKSEVTAVIETMNSNDIVELLLEKDREDISYEFIEEIRAAAEKISFDRRCFSFLSDCLRMHISSAAAFLFQCRSGYLPADLR